MASLLELTTGKLSRRHFLRAGAGCVGLSLLAACAAPAISPAPTAPDTGATSTGNSKMDQWYAAARKEGEAVWASATPGAYRSLIDRFERQFPGVKVTAIQADGTTIADRMTLESQNRRVSIDINQSGLNQTTVLLSRDLLVPYDFSDTAVDSSQVLLDGKLIAIADAIAGWTYNSQLLAEQDLPRSWDDLLDPKWTNKIVSLASGALFDMLLYSMDENAMLEYLKQLGPQIVPVNTTAEALRRVSTGEALITNAATTQVIVDQIAQGAPLAALPLPAQETPTGFFSVKGVPHPNAAALFIAWAASPEQKSALTEVGLGRYQDCGPLATDQFLCNRGVDILFIDTPEKTAQPVRLRPEIVKALGFKPV
jgi:iron(III) transport system substrate-binding protein